LLDNRIIFRADGNSEMGLGHLVRTMALMEMLKESFHCVLWLRDPGEKVRLALDLSIAHKLMPVFDSVAEEIESMQRELLRSDILVLDGYHFDSNYQLALKPFVHKLVSIDDLAETYFYADLVINHGSREIVKRYRTEPYSKILAGVQYLLLRKPFIEAALKLRPEVTSIDSLFICMGGADPYNVTNKVLRVALQLPFLQRIVVVVGGAYSFRQELDDQLKSLDNGKIVSLEKGVSAARMVTLIEQSHLAIAPASSIALEIASVKSGLLTAMVADNQQAIHNMIIENGCAVSAGDFNTISENALRDAILQMNNLPLLNGMIKKQAVFIDGLSGSRLLKEFKTLVNAQFSFC
jgi:UDP-2,4-diacetamido-2,4,6-trideoxy-beta-L-altropyranose hydrolase